MKLSTTHWRWLLMAIVFIGITGTAHAQRTVTLKLNTATIPDTIRTDSDIKVMGAFGGEAPFTLPDGNVISWDTGGANESTLNVENVGGDYWEISFEIPETDELVFKFWSEQAQETLLEGWEADPNPTIEAGSDDVEMPLHYFEAQKEWHGVSGDRGPYDWRPFESKEDSVAVWFRVFASTDAAVSNAGYDRSNPDLVVGVRGDPLGGEGALDWGATKVQLSPESSNQASPAFHIFSGVAYYPESLAGTTQEYKFFVEPEGWEGMANNRSFTIPAQDTTLQWVYFSESPAATAQPVESGVIFSVDLSPLEAIGVFNTARGDTLQVRGEFNNWNCDDPDRCLLPRAPSAPGEPIVYEQVIPITAMPGAEFRYKFLIEFNDQAFMDEFGVETVPGGWEEPISTTGADRSFIFEGNPNDFQDLGVQRFNDVMPGNIVEEGTSIDVNFSVDMTPALDAAEPFDPAADTVTIEIGDPIWLFTQRLLEDAENGAIPSAIVLEDPDGDMIYEGTLTFSGPTYAALQYKYAYGAGTTFQREPGGDTAGLGRRRTRFVAPNADGSWPATWDFPQETFQTSGNLPFETNPLTVGVEEIGGELPAKIALGQNYPNPFNPSTTFEYSLDQTQHVSVKVFDVTGRLVQTLVDGVQSASTYRVTFDGANLASGIYIYRLETPSQVITKKMTLIK